MDHDRKIDRWLKWMVVIGPLTTFILGIGTGSWATYQCFTNQDRRISLIEGWKEKQDDFNKNTVTAISRIKALIRDPQP